MALRTPFVPLLPSMRYPALQTCSPIPFSAFQSISRGGALKVEATSRANTRKDSANVRNRRLQRNFNGTAKKPRLSVFCSDKQLYAMLVDDQNKKTLFYASTLQRSLREDPPGNTAEVAQRVGEELVKACIDLNITEISSYDRNGFSRGERMQSFEIAISQYGFLQ